MSEPPKKKPRKEKPKAPAPKKPAPPTAHPFGRLVIPKDVRIKDSAWS